LHVRRGFFMGGLDFAGPKTGLQSDAARELLLFLKLQTLLQRDVFSPHDLAISLRLREDNARRTGDRKRLVAEFSDFVFDVVLHHAHRRHHDNDGKNADQHAEQRERRAQFVRRHRAHRHEKTFADFGEQKDWLVKFHLFIGGARLRRALIFSDATIQAGGLSLCKASLQSVRPISFGLDFPEHKSILPNNSRPAEAGDASRAIGISIRRADVSGENPVSKMSSIVRW
jgi:hypothetical protein